MEKDLGIIIRYLDGDMDENEVNDFIKHINGDKEFAALYFQMKEIFDLSASKYQKVDNDYLWKRMHNRIEANQSDKKPKRFFDYNYIYKIAAALVLIIGLGLLIKYSSFQKNDPKITQYTETIIPKTEKGKVILPDGSEVWLNSESVLKYPSRFGKNNRKVILKGEAFFNITKNTQKPFVVSTSQINIKVLGTSFNVMSYENDNVIETTLVSGKVSIENNKSGSGEKEKIILKPSHKATFNKEIKSISLEEVNTSLYTSWKEGEYIFEDELLSIITKRIERWYDIKIHFKTGSLKSLRLSGSIRENEPLEQIFDMISLAARIRYKIEDNNVILMNI